MAVIEKALKQDLIDFFGTGTLAQKENQVKILLENKAVTLLIVNVPWILRLTETQETQGHSETMKKALQDIAANLRRLIRQHGGDTEIEISINEKDFLPHEKKKSVQDYGIKTWQGLLKHTFK